MFYYAESFNQKLHFDTRNVIDMRMMFYNAKSFNQKLNFDTSNVTNIYGMFCYAKQLNKNFHLYKKYGKFIFENGENINVPKKLLRIINYKDNKVIMDGKYKKRLSNRRNSFI